MLLNEEDTGLCEPDQNNILRRVHDPLLIGTTASDRALGKVRVRAVEGASVRSVA